MSKKLSILTLLVGIILLLSFSANPPDGRTNAPGEGLCSDCHSLGGATQNGMISVSGFPSSIIPNTEYTLTMTSTMTFDPTPADMERAGFQITILNDNDEQAGTISNPSTGSTVSSTGGRQYWDHAPSQVYPANDVVVWTATWTSPSTPANTMITYYAAGNIANGNGTNSGDRIVTNTGSGMLMGGGANLMVTITSTDILCFGQNTGSATANATGGEMPYSYSWSNGSSNQTINNLPAGSYTVTVTDDANATATANVIIDSPDELEFNSPVINHVSCNGGNNGSISVSATGGVIPYFFSWSNGSNGTTISNLTAGSYTVTVTDDNNCTETATYVVNQPALLVINLEDLNHESCFGDEDGSITISVSGGANPVFAEWSNGSIGFSITDLAPDTYSVTVTDNNDCIKTATYVVNEGGVVDVALVQLVHVTCNGGSNGSITINASGGVPPYSYSWSNGMTGAAISGLPAGGYIVTVTDMNGCDVVEGYTINQPPPINISIAQSSPNQCFGDATADLTASASGGNAPYTAQWSNGIAGLVNNDLAAGTYTITVTDNSGCTNTQSAVVTEPPLLTVVVVTTDETAAGANDGTAMANVGGGTAGYSYVWSNGATTQMLAGLAPGVYSVTVTDMNGCTAAGSGQVDAFGCTIDVTLAGPTVICENTSATISSAVMGASGPYTYLWSNGSTDTTITVSIAGEYCLTVTDEANCQDMACITIDVIVLLPFDCPVTNESAPGANDGAINCEAAGFITYLWSNGATTPGISGLSPGQYCVTVTDMAGCTNDQCFNVQPGDCQMVVSSTQLNVACSGDTTGWITLSVAGGTEPITYLWSTGETTAVIQNLGAGEYQVTVSDAAGCVDLHSIVITEPDPLVIVIDSIAPLSDTGPGLIHISLTGGVPPYSYLWTNPGGTNFTTEDLNDLEESGYYSLVVTDANGCSVSQDSIFVDMDVAVDPTPRHLSLRVFPVPSDDVLYIALERPVLEAQVYGVDGRKYVHFVQPADNRLDITALDSGWYVLRIFDGTNWYIARFVK